MNKMLGIDVGIKRVGIASLHNERAVPQEAVPRAGGKAEERIIKMVNEEKIELLVVGLPLGANGERTTQCEDVEKFIRRVERRCIVQVIYVDEFSTSVDAEEVLVRRYGGSLSPKQRTQVRKRGDIDAVSAALILQKYLDSRVAQ